MMTSTFTVASVQVGKRETLDLGRRQVVTGIHKRPSGAPIHVGEHGVSGDAVCDTRHHGGADQAVYVYLMADYEYWSRQYQREFTPGEFGENITITGDPDYEWKIGDRLQFDEVHIEVTAPRIPCWVLEASIGIKHFSAAFAKANRSGFYARVLNAGQIGPGEKGVLTQSAFDVTVKAMLNANYGHPSREVLEALVSAPIDARSRKKFEQALSTAG